jgi:predicted MFS family arabinose efflux permease
MLHTDAEAHPRLSQNRNYVLAMVTLIYVVNYINRQILNILLPQIKAEFHLTDTQLGLLAGPIFAVVYALLGLPLALAADRMSRRNLITVTLGLFSAATFVSGYISSFLQLLTARFVTGIGEAGTSPAAAAMISDLFPAEKRATALGIYASGLNIGVLIAFFCGGWIAQEYGWRTAFMAAGVPGLILMFLFPLTVAEPQRGQVDLLRDAAQAPGIGATVAHLWAQRSFRYLVGGASLGAFTGYAGLAFNPSFLSRSHHLTPTEIGLMLASLTGFCGFLGTMLAGRLADRLGKKDRRWGMYVSAIGPLLAVPAFPLFYLSGNMTLTVFGAVIPSLINTAFMGPCFAAVQGLSPLRMRAKAQAIFLFLVNMVGLGCGPQWVGLASDWMQPRFGADSLRYAMLTTAIPLIASAWCFWKAAESIRENMTSVAAASR